MLQRRQFLKFSPTLPPTPPESDWLHVNRTIMACRFEITLPSGSPAAVEAAQAQLAAADRLEAQLSIFREHSEVSLLNRRAAAEAEAAVPVSASLFELLRLCRLLYRDSKGAFDITSAPLSRCWGFLRRAGRIPTDAELQVARSLVGGDKLLLDDAEQSVRFAQAGVEINLGSIGKGYALDCLQADLRRRARVALISAGASSFYAVGAGVRQRGWQVGIRHPRRRQRRLAILKLRDAALATSGDEEQYFEYAGRRYGHIIDPRSGQPAAGVTSVSVVASSAAVADALATAFYVGGRQLAQAYTARRPNVLVIMLESDAEEPIIFGSHPDCEVEIIRE